MDSSGKTRVEVPPKVTFLTILAKFMTPPEFRINAPQMVGIKLSACQSPELGGRREQLDLELSCLQPSSRSLKAQLTIFGSV